MKRKTILLGTFIIISALSWISFSTRSQDSSVKNFQFTPKQLTYINSLFIKCGLNKTPKDSKLIWYAFEDLPSHPKGIQSWVFWSKTAIIITHYEYTFPLSECISPSMELENFLQQNHLGSYNSLTVEPVTEGFDDASFSYFITQAKIDGTTTIYQLNKRSRQAPRN